MSTKAQTQHQYKRESILPIEKIIEILSKNKIKFNKFIPYIKKYFLSENIRKRMNINSNERFEGMCFLIKKIPKNQNQHNKFMIDNTMKKVRVYLLNYLVFSINKKLEEEGIELGKINYDYKSNLNKEVNINDLNKSIKDLLSINKNNEQKIRLILNKKNNKIEEMFNLSFREWIYIFTLEIEPSKNENKFDGFDLLLEEILKNNGDEQNYLCDFIFCVYNYEIWIKSKKIKINKKKE